MIENPFKLLIEKFLKIFGMFVGFVMAVGLIIFGPIILNAITDKPWTWWTYIFFIPLGITILIVMINLIDFSDLWDFDEITDAFDDRKREKKRLREEAEKRKLELQKEFRDIDCT